MEEVYVSVIEMCRTEPWWFLEGWEEDIVSEVWGIAGFNAQAEVVGVRRALNKSQGDLMTIF